MDRELLQPDSLDVDIGSKEGLSVDQMTRSRLQFLLGQNTNIVRQTQMADAKAGTLLAIVGVLTLIVADRQLGVHPQVMALHFAVTLVIVATCLLALFPRVPGARDLQDAARTDFFSWPVLGADEVEPERFAALMRTSNASQLVMWTATSNVRIARVLRRKYRYLRLALLVAFIDLVALVLVLGGLLDLLAA